MRIRTSRIGLVTVTATAPVLQAQLTDTRLEFTVGIDRVDTGNPLLNPELHALVRALTEGTLEYRGARDGRRFTGHASAGDIVVPLDLHTQDPSAPDLDLVGRSEFRDIDVPVSWIGHLGHLAVDIDGTLHLA